MELESILASPPVVHWGGQNLPMALAPEVLRVIDSAVGPESRTLETGSGLSTALFAAKGCEHHCVVPVRSEILLLEEWCRGHGVSLDRVTFHCAPSEDVLPTLEGGALDLVLIDGAHGFPCPFIDWFYAGRRLRQGGLLVVDDTQIWTGRVLRQYLREDPEWELVSDFTMRASAFRRLRDGSELEDWTRQPFVVSRSYSHGARGLVRRALKGAELLRRGRIRELAAASRRR
jgi:predicted O-methyltransferase YrrM